MPQCKIQSFETEMKCPIEAILPGPGAAVDVFMDSQQSCWRRVHECGQRLCLHKQFL